MVPVLRMSYKFVAPSIFLSHIQKKKILYDSTDMKYFELANSETLRADESLPGAEGRGRSGGGASWVHRVYVG